MYTYVQYLHTYILADTFCVQFVHICITSLQLCTGVLCVLPFAACEQPVCTAYTELSEAYESHDVHKLEMVAAKYEQLFARVRMHNRLYHPHP